MEFTSEILQVLAKRAWKLSWILVLYAIVSLVIVVSIFIHKKLFVLSNIQNLNPNILEILKFFSESFLISVVIFGIFFILKTDSDNTIKKSRDKVYNKFIDRVKLVFKYRYDFPLEKYTKGIQNLTQYSKKFYKDDKRHIIEIKNLKTYLVQGIDTLYVKYTINEEESILFSIWHSGNFVAVAIAIDKNILDISEDIINEKFESTLNLQGAKNSEENKLSLRDNYWWFDVMSNEVVK